MKKLRELHLNDNKLTGDIPESLYAQLAKPVPHENATRGTGPPVPVGKPTPRAIPPNLSNSSHG